MTALLVLLLAAASVVDGSAWVRGRTSRSPAKARLLAGVPAVAALGVLIGWPILRLHGSGIILGILVAVAWLSSALVPQRWWGRLRRFSRAERVGAEDDVDRVVRLARLARAGVLILAVAFCAVASQPLGSGVAKVIAAVGAVILLTVPANRVVADILAVARHSTQGNGKAVAAGCEPSQESGKQDESGSSMRGGRWIGPLERILILLLASVEAPAAIAAIVAAKGVIRFPEISQDKAGQKAEEFLVGSFASWILAVLGAVTIHLA